MHQNNKKNFVEIFCTIWIHTFQFITYKICERENKILKPQF